MPEGAKFSEGETTTLNITDRVMEIIEGEEINGSPGRTIDLMKLMETPEIRNASHLTLELPWYGPDWAQWVKSWYENPSALSRRQIRKASIICNKSQKKLVDNVFASGVEWINSDKTD